MKIEVSKKEFLNALQIGGSLAGNNKILPILDCVKMIVKSDNIVIVSSDNENAISKKLVENVTSDTECSFCVDKKDFLSYVKLIGDYTFTITSDDMKSVQVKHSKGEFELPIQPAEDFPSMQPDNDCDDMTIEGSTLKKWIQNALKFSASDDLRPQMNGLYVYVKDGEKGCCASDGHVLYTEHTQVDNENEMNFNANKNALKVLKDVLSDNMHVTVKIGSRNTLFHTAGCSVIARNIEGRYPNFKSVISKTNDIVVTLDREEFIEAVVRSSVGANKASQIVRLHFDGFTLEVNCEDIDYNKRSKELLNFDGSADIVIGFNYNKLLSVLDALETEKITISMKSPSVQGIFREVGGDENKLIILMPIMVQ